MKRIYLDSNAFSYCLWTRPGSAWTPEGLADLRVRIEQAWWKDEISILGSQYHVEEASRMKPDERRNWMVFFWNTVRWNLLLPTDELVRLEASLRRCLSGNEPYDEVWRRQRIRSTCLRSGDSPLDAVAPEVKAYAERFAESQKDRKAKVQGVIATKYAGKTSREVTKGWWADPVAQINDWVNDYIKSSKDHLGLANDPSEWPTPRQLPTAWNMHAYQMARIVMTVGLNRKIGDGDAHDAHHYAGACFADLLVTNDGGFRDTVVLIPDAVSVTDFDSFGAILGVTPH